ncbi:hypothetical protein SH139x_001034 [Planctomycetaceae bacterium SH139]
MTSRYHGASPSRRNTIAEESERELPKSGFDMKKLSIVGKDYRTDEHLVDCLCTNA